MLRGMELPDRKAQDRLGEWQAAERAEADATLGSNARRRAGALSRRARWSYEDASREAGQDQGAAPEAFGDKMRRSLTRLGEASRGADDLARGHDATREPGPESNEQRDKRAADDAEMTRELDE